MPSTRRTVWITRAQPGADQTAERVRMHGHAAVVAPLLEVQPGTGFDASLAGVAALAFTSANGVRAFTAVSLDRALPVFAVGAATALAARAAGYRRVLSTDRDVSALAEALVARRRELVGAVLHPGAAEPAGDLVGMLTARGVEARGVVVYDTVGREPSADEENALKAVDTVLIHSAKAARGLAARLKAAPRPELRVVGLSRAAIQPLARVPLAARLFPPKPLEAEALNLLDLAS